MKRVLCLTTPWSRLATPADPLTNSRQDLKLNSLPSDIPHYHPALIYRHSQL